MLSALYSYVRKIFSIGAHLNSLPLTTVVEFFPNLSAIYTKWCAQTFPPIFGLFAIFDRNFVNIVAPSSDKDKNCVVRVKGLSDLKKPKTAS